MEVLATQVNSPSGTCPHSQTDNRLDVAKQLRGDLKETYNMGKFADPDYKHNEPDTITKRREELLAFQKECYQVELKVLVLFALALDVPRPWNDVDLTVALRLFLEVSHGQRRYI